MTASNPVVTRANFSSAILRRCLPRVANSLAGPLRSPRTGTLQPARKRRVSHHLAGSARAGPAAPDPGARFALASLSQVEFTTRPEGRRSVAGRLDRGDPGAAQDRDRRSAPGSPFSCGTCSTTQSITRPKQLRSRCRHWDGRSSIRVKLPKERIWTSGSSRFAVRRAPRFPGAGSAWQFAGPSALSTGGS